jgi:hypothetical protein
MLEKSSVSLWRRLLLQNVAELHLPDVHGEDGGEEEGLEEKVGQQAHHSNAAEFLEKSAIHN